MKGRLAPLLASALVVAACGGGGNEGEAQRGPTRIANPYHDQLMGLSPFWQHLTLMRAIRDNGNRCRRVEAGRYQADYRNLALWVALCDDGRYWGVFIAPNGDTQVRKCDEMRQLGLPPCRPLTGPGAVPESNTAAPANAAAPATNTAQ
jgi:hypothetical protein